jgi:hypothetical protein
MPKFDFGFEPLKDSIEWLAKRMASVELRMDKYGDLIDENNLKISDLEANSTVAPVVEKAPPVKIEAPPAPVITIIERKADA